MSDENEDEYDMNHEQRGIALIINIINVNIPDMHQREGSEEDVNFLKKTFKDSLEFKIVKSNNKDLSAKEIHDAVKKYALEDHSNYDCFLLVLMSHGNDNLILGADGKPVYIKDLQDIIKKSETLKGKPKLIFIQACRGKKVFEVAEDFDSSLSTFANSSEYEHVSDDAIDLSTDSNARYLKMRQRIPVERDFLIHYSTTANYYSYRIPGYGSVFIRAMCQVFDEWSGKDISLVNLLTKVNNKVSEFEAEIGNQLIKQVSSFETRLIKNVYFRSKKKPKIRKFFSKEIELEKTEIFSIEISHNLSTRKDKFIGRKNLLEKIDESFDEVCKGVVLTAFGGSGKTSLANEYGFNKAKQLDDGSLIIRWFECETKEKIKRDYRNFAGHLLGDLSYMSQQEIIDRVNTKLSSSKGQKFLLILDNVEHYEEIEEFIDCLPKKRVKLLITTRNNQLISINDSENIFKTIQVDSFDEEETLEYIEKNLKKQILSDEQISKLTQLVKNPNNDRVLPLKLNLTVKFLNSNPIQNINKLLEKIEIERTAMRDVEDYLFENINSKSPDSLKLLNYCTLLDPDVISFNLLNNLLIHLKIENKDNELINKLTTAGMVEIDHQKELIKIHRIIQHEMINFRKRNQDQFDNENEMIKTIMLTLINSDDENIEIWTKMMSHFLSLDFDYIQAKTILEMISQKKFVKTRSVDVALLIARLKITVGRYNVFYTEKFDIANKYFNESLKLYCAIFSNDKGNEEKAKCYNYIGLSLQTTSEKNTYKSLKCHQKAYEMRLKLFENNDHPLLVESLKNIGLNYFYLNILQLFNLNESRESLKYFLEAYEMSKRLYEKKKNQLNHFNLAELSFYVGTAYFQLERLDANFLQKALEYFLEAEKIYSKLSKTYSENYLYVVTLDCISFTLKYLCDNEKSTEYKEKFLKVYEKINKKKDQLSDILGANKFSKFVAAHGINGSYVF